MWKLRRSRRVRQNSCSGMTRRCAQKAGKQPQPGSRLQSQVKALGALETFMSPQASDPVQERRSSSGFWGMVNFQQQAGCCQVFLFCCSDALVWKSQGLVRLFRQAIRRQQSAPGVLAMRPVAGDTRERQYPLYPRLPLTESRRP